MVRLFLLLSVCYTTLLTAQNDYSVANIPEDLLDNANAVIRYESMFVEFDAINSMTLKGKKVVTVFNKKGLGAVSHSVGYDESSSVKDIGAIVYDSQGKEIKKYKKRDFTDLSATGSSLYTDNRVMTIDHTIASYPFTFEFFFELDSSSTVLFPAWDPSPIYRVSTQYSVYTLENPRRIPITVRKFNLDEFGVRMEESPARHFYEIRNLKAIDREHLSPDYTEFTPVVKLAPTQFELAGKRGNVTNWRDFGIWQKSTLLSGRDKLPKETIRKVTELVQHIEDPKEKARIIYNYMQEKTRYISVQVGIGGWQPSTASEVDRLGYGDCKGLTNYTQALLKSQGIESLYTIVDAGEDGKDIDEEFVALQGNHVILTVPFEDETVFLECTSQQLPFNFIGTHTDDRNVILITDEGGVLTRTHVYSPDDNIKHLTAELKMDASFGIAGDLQIESGGLVYGERFSLEQQSSDDIKLIYKSIWGHLNDLKLSDINFNNDKREVRFRENMRIETDNYVSKAGSRILVNPNIFKRIEDIPTIETDRTQPFEIRRGSTQRDTIRLQLPENYKLESLFDPIEISNEFGSYKATVVHSEDNQLLYVRELRLNSGRFPKDRYNDYVKFIKTLLRNDRSKIVLVPG